jgi:hypothetical protein
VGIDGYCIFSFTSFFFSFSSFFFSFSSFFLLSSSLFLLTFLFPLSLSPFYRPGSYFSEEEEKRQEIASGDSL